MKKSRIKLISSLVVVALVIFCVVFFSIRETQNKNFIKTALSECDFGSDLFVSSKKFLCLYEKATQNNELDLCSRIYNSDIQSDCIRKIAIQKNNINLCEKIFTDKIYDKDICYFDLAYKNKDINFCNKINNSETQEHCNKCVRGEQEEALCLPVERLPDGLSVENAESVASDYVQIATKPVTDLLINDFAKVGNVLDYRINDIKFVADRTNTEDYYRDSFVEKDSKDAFIVTVDFSVQSDVKPGEMNLWIAGNGEEGSDGWILNKFMYIKVDKDKDGNYFAYFIGTGL
jgi:hypothetical protein